MEQKVEEFKEYWKEHKNFISLELEDHEIVEFLERANNRIQLAVEWASDYLLANGLADVQE
jgi:hypothetical protein